MAGENSSFTNQNTTYPAGPETHPVSPRSETFDISGPETHPAFPPPEISPTDSSGWSLNEWDIPIDLTGPNPSDLLPDAARFTLPPDSGESWISPQFISPTDFDILNDVIKGLERNPKISNADFHMWFKELKSEKEVGGVQRDIISQNELSNEVLDGKLSPLDQPSVDAFKDGPDVGIVDSNTTVANGSEGSTTKTQERKRKKKGVSFDISLENVLQFSALSRRNAALELKVSESTLKRVCRKCGIRRWPPRGIHKNGGRAMRPPDLGQPSMDAVNNGRSFIGTERSNLDVALSDSIIRQERKKGKTGVKIEIPREVVLQYSDMRLVDAARKLKVCSATLKRICRDYGIRRWPPRN